MNEIIIENGDIKDVEAWLGVPLSTEILYDDITLMKYVSGDSVVVTPNIEGKNWLSVAPSHKSFKNCNECAYNASSKISKGIIFDPEDKDLNPFRFMYLKDGVAEEINIEHKE